MQSLKNQKHANKKDLATDNETKHKYKHTHPEIMGKKSKPNDVLPAIPQDYFDIMLLILS